LLGEILGENIEIKSEILLQSGRTMHTVNKIGDKFVRNLRRNVFRCY